MVAMRTLLICGTALLMISATVIAVGQKSVRVVNAPVKYAAVKGMLNNRCGGCHGGKFPAHELNLTSYAAIMQGDGDGKVVIVKKANMSRLSKYVHRSDDKRMPPPPEKMLTAKELKLLDDWINGGAKP